MRSLAWLVIFVGCSYADADLDGTRFRCDGDKPCPSGQVCAGTVCVARTHDGVACTTACTRDQQCCIDGTNPPRCIGAADTCLGRAAACDGVEDCAAGMRCCADGAEQACGVEGQCGRYACLEADDCPGTAPNCCPDAFDPQPWKYCSLTPC